MKSSILFCWTNYEIEFALAILKSVWSQLSKYIENSNFQNNRNKKALWEYLCGIKLNMLASTKKHYTDSNCRADRDLWGKKIARLNIVLWRTNLYSSKKYFGQTFIAGSHERYSKNILPWKKIYKINIVFYIASMMLKLLLKA